MRDKIELTGIILSSTLIGDYDKRLVILTKEKGKITAFARGARKPNSPLMGVSEPFNYGVFTLMEGYDAYRFLGADVKEYFLDVKKDIDKICYATYFCEILEYLCMEGVGDIHMLNLLYVSLKAIEKKEIDFMLIRRIFELRVLAIDGEAMAAFSCAKCGEKKLIAYCDTVDGLLCEKCVKLAGRVIHLSESTVYTIQFVLSVSLSKLYSFRLSKDSWTEFDKVVEQFFNRHVTKKFKSLEILSSLT